MSEDPADRLEASRARDAAILADLGRREAGRWRRDYVIGAVVLTLPAVVRGIGLRPDRRA